MAFTAVACSLDAATGVGGVTLARPQVSNAVDRAMWTELPLALKSLEEQGARCIVLSGAGRNFCGGIDLQSLTAQLQGDAAAAGCAGRGRYHFRNFVFELQEAVTALESCRCPVIAAVHGACVGAGVDLITACDLRYATSDARLCVKEADLAIVADMGTLQRLPGIVGDGVARDLALTARQFSGEEARSLGLVSRTFPSREALAAGVAEVAAALAAKSPLALAGTKRLLLYQRDHSVADGLDYVALWNAAMLQSEDLREVFAARAEGRRPAFSKL